MVRRWSFISVINNSLYFRYKSLQHGLMDTNVNAVMYLRKNHAPVTRLRRRQWSRRKHLYNWLTISSLLKFWANRYRLHRNSHKFTQHLFLTQYSWITSGAVFHRQYLRNILQQSSEISVSSMTKILFKQYNCLSSFSQLTLLQYSGTLPLLIYVRSSVLSSTTIQILQLLGDVAYSSPRFNLFERELSNISCETLFHLLQQQLTTVFFTKLKLFYRSCILLILFWLS